jgi:hypothetical protein
MLGQRVNVRERNVYSRFPATIRTSRAIDLFFHGSGDLMKQVIPVVVMLEKSPKAKIFATLVFSDLMDLDKIRDHVSSILLLSVAGTTIGALFFRLMSAIVGN